MKENLEKCATDLAQWQKGTGGGHLAIVTATAATLHEAPSTIAPPSHHGRFVERSNGPHAGCGLDGSTCPPPLECNREPVPSRLDINRPRGTECFTRVANAFEQLTNRLAMSPRVQEREGDKPPLNR